MAGPMGRVAGSAVVVAAAKGSRCMGEEPQGGCGCEGGGGVRGYGGMLPYQPCHGACAFLGDFVGVVCAVEVPCFLLLVQRPRGLSVRKKTAKSAHLIYLYSQIERLTGSGMKRLFGVMTFYSKEVHRST